MANYCTSADLYNMYGELNIQKWADLDNTKNPDTVDTRVAWACEFATEFINARLVRGKYAIPFTSVPKTIVFITTLQAGIMLYDGRRVVSDRNRDEVGIQRKQLNTYLRQILAGQLKMIHPTSGEELTTQSETVPAALDETDYEDDE